MERSRPLVAVLFSLLIASSMVAGPATAAFATDAGGAEPAASPGLAPLESVASPTTGTTTLAQTETTDNQTNSTPELAAAELPDVDGQRPRDLDDDGRYEDVNGDGSFTNSDVVDFFGAQHVPKIQGNASYFDFDGSGDVGQSDVITLFDAVGADRRSAVIVPRVPIDTDGDGLTDRFELNVSETDPLDANSTSLLTDQNESANAAVDGAEDLSGNGLQLVYAARYDLDPLANDTDGDGLGDVAEIGVPNLDPTSADSDGDGTDDAADDLDGDGLANAEEVDLGTALASEDTDGDGLSDVDEVEGVTNATLLDTDDDGLDDATERRIEAVDASVADTDGDGTLDGDETLTTELAHEESGVDVTVTGEGDVASSIRVTNASGAVGDTVGPAVRLANGTSFETATVEVPLDPSLSESELSNVTLARWDGSNTAPWTPIETTVDADARTATATVSRLGYFVPRTPTTDRSVTVDAAPSTNFNESETDCTGLCTDDQTDVTLDPSDEVIEAPSPVDLDGETAEEVDVDVTPDAPADVNYTVADDGSTNYSTIGGALDDADAGATILVEAGTYDEAVVIDQEVTLVGQGAVIAPPSGETALTVETGATVRGVELQPEAADGVQVTGSNGQLRLERSRVSGAQDAIDASGSGMDVTLRSAAVTDNTGYGINASDASGDWSLSNVVFRRSTAVAGGTDHTILATASTGDWSLSTTEFSGVFADSSEGDWTIESGTVDGNTEKGVSAAGTQGDWTLRDLTIENVNIGVSAGGSSGDWTLEDVAIADTAEWGQGIIADGVYGAWRLDSVSIRRTHQAVRAHRFKGEFVASDLTVQNNDAGIVSTDSAGPQYDTWRIADSRFAGNEGPAVTVGARSDWAVERTAFGGSGTLVDATAANASVDLRRNWWGEDGFDASQVDGDARTGDALPAPPSEIDAGATRSPYAVEPGPGSKYTWQQELPETDDGDNAVWVAYRADASGDAPSVTLEAEGEGGEQAWSVPADTDGVRYERLAGASIGSEAALTVRAIQTSVTIESVRVHGDADGDGLSDRVERAEIVPQIGSVDAFTTEVGNEDTDGDGVLDGVEVGIVGQDLSGDVSGGELVVESVVSDPTEANSDGDDLSDRVEHRQRQVRLLQSHDAARGFMQGLAAGEFDAAAGHATREYVTSDPLQADSDGDGLLDHEEAELGTDPEARDSDGDAIGDETETDNDLDPTAFDVTPPEVAVNWIETSSNLELSFDAITDTTVVEGSYHVFDLAGVDSATILHGQHVQEEDEFAGQPVQENQPFEYSVDAAGTAVDAMTGFQTRIVATDVYGNERAVVAQEVNSGFTLTAQNLGIDDEAGAPATLGLLAGFTGGAGETFVAIKAAGTGTASLAASLYDSPLDTAAAFEEQLEAIRQLDNWDEYAEAIAESFERQMRTANPYDFDTQRAAYEDFRTTYYAGVLLFEVALTVATAGTVQAASKTGTASKIASAASGTKLATAAKAVSRTYSAVSAPSRFTKQKLVTAAARTGSVTVDGARALYSGTSTVGKTLQIRKVVSGVDLNKIDSLSPAAQRRAGNILSNTELSDDDTVRLISRIDSLDDGSRDRALEYLADGDGTRTRLLSEFDQETLDAFFPTRCSPTRVAGAASPGGTLATGRSASVIATAQDGSLGCLQDPEQFREDLEVAFRQNGNVESADAADVVEYVDSVDDDAKRARARLLVDKAGGNGGAEFLADADTDTRDAVLSFEVDTSDSDLPDDLDDQVRLSLVEEYSRGHFSLDGWADDIYDVDSEAAVAGEIADDIDALDDADNVEGLGRLLSKESGEESSGGGSYLAEVREMSPATSDDPTKGAALELRVARTEAPDPGSSATLRLDYEPDVDFTELTESDLEDVAEKVVGQRDAALVRNELISDGESKEVELDAFRDSESESMEMYAESKNRGKIERDDVQPQIIRYFATRKAEGADLDSSMVTIYTRTDSQSNELEELFGSSWFTANGPSELN